MLLTVPYQTLEAIRAKLPLVGSASSWLGGIAPGLDMEHLVAFALLGALARFAQLRPRPVLTLLGLGLFGFATEMAQLWIASRSPHLDDLMLNVGGALLGYATAALLVRLWPFRPRT